MYAGTLWNLTSIAPLADALARVAASRPALLARLELVVVGRKTPEQREHLQRIQALGCRLADVEYCDHTVALATMRSADALLLLLSDLPGVERVVPAKLFEYFAMQRPMLALLPEGESADLVRSVQPAAHRLPNDVAGIAGWLEARLESITPEAYTADTASITSFDRRTEAGQLSALLGEVLGGGRA